MCFQNYPSESSLQMTTNVLKMLPLLPCVFAFSMPLCVALVSLIASTKDSTGLTQCKASVWISDSVASRAFGEQDRGYGNQGFKSVTENQPDCYGAAKKQRSARSTARID